MRRVLEVNKSGFYPHPKSREVDGLPRICLGDTAEDHGRNRTRPKRDKRNGGITAGDMQAYKDLNKGLIDPFPTNRVRGPEAHPNRPHAKEPHGHVGPIHYIPIVDK